MSTFGKNTVSNSIKEICVKKILIFGFDVNIKNKTMPPN